MCEKGSEVFSNVNSKGEHMDTHAGLTKHGFNIL